MNMEYISFIIYISDGLIVVMSRPFPRQGAWTRGKANRLIAGQLRAMDYEGYAIHIVVKFKSIVITGGFTSLSP